jgi:hypothetical protein
MENSYFVDLNVGTLFESLFFIMPCFTHLYLEGENDDASLWSQRFPAHYPSLHRQRTTIHKKCQIFLLCQPKLN